jgi:hypothetical protein
MVSSRAVRLAGV